MTADQPLVVVNDLTVTFDAGRTGFWGRERQLVHAVDGVSLAIRDGETLGLVGESGSGKTTTGRAILRRTPVTRGTIRFRDRDITSVAGEELRSLRRHMQLIFQDPYSSLNPRHTILDTIAEPMIVHGMARKAGECVDRVAELLELTGLPADTMHRHPHAFSGGQRQRIGIARALALEPEFIVADEPVSALDVSIRAQVVNLLQDVQERLGLTYLFIAHDLALVRHISHRIAIMYAGRLVEVADAETIYNTPLHPYTEALLSAVPIPDPKVQHDRQRIVLQGDPPSPLAPPPGCRFQTRCPLVEDRCRTDAPPLEERTTGHEVACWVR